MRQHLEASGVAWEAREDGKVAFAASLNTTYDRQARSLVAHKGVFEAEFMKKMGEILVSDRLKLYLPMSQHTISARALGFRLVTSAAGLCLHLLIAPHQQFPLRLLAAAGGGAERTLEEVAQAKPCLMDPWSKSFVKHYEGRLASDEAMADLAATAFLVQMDTAQIEARHSGIRRRLVKAGVQTHVPEIERVSAEFCCAYLSREHGRLKRLVRDSCAPGKASNGEGDARPKKRRRGGGGSWRAFCHTKCAGRCKADFAKLAVEYHAEMERGGMADLKTSGEIGTRAHKLGHQAFGPTSRQAGRARQNNLRDSIVAKASATARAALTNEVGLQRSGTDCHTLVALQSTHALVDARPGLGSWEGYIAETQAIAKGMDATRRAIEAETAVALEEWVGSTGVVTSRSIEVVLPALAANALKAQPSGLGQLRLWNWHSGDTQKVVARGVAVRGQLGVGKDLRKALEQDWQAKHAMVSHDNVPPIVGRARATSACHEAGQCLCSEEGRELRLFGARLLEVVREVCPPSSTLRVALVESMLGYLLTGTPIGEGDGDVDEQGEGQSGEADFPKFVFLHVALHYLKPFRPIFQRMELETLDNGAAQCRVTAEWQTMYEALGGLGRKLKWGFRLFRLKDSMAPIGNFTMSLHDYIEVPLAAAEFTLWAGPPDKERSRRSKWADDRGGGEGEEEEVVEAADDVEVDALEGGESEQSAASDIDPWFESDDADDGGVVLAGEDDASAQEDEPGTDLVESAAHVAEAPASLPAEAPHQPRRVEAAGARNAPEIIFRVPRGEIRYYARIRRFAAWCHNEAHGRRCRREKVAYEGRGGGQGRPLGLLMAWLARGDDHATSRDHMDLELLIDFESRQIGRQALQAMEGSEAMLAKERPMRNGEDEPVEHP